MYRTKKVVCLRIKVLVRSVYKDSLHTFGSIYLNHSGHILKVIYYDEVTYYVMVSFDVKITNDVVVT